MSMNRCAVTFLLLALTLSAFAAADIKIVATTQPQFDACTRDGNVDLRTDPGSVQLAPIDYLIEDKGDKIGPACKDLKWWGKKVFQLDEPQAKGAAVYVFRDPGEATFNGTAIQFAKQGAGNWYVATIPAEVLKAGVNELVMHACTVPVDIQAKDYEHSFYSPDRGATWEPTSGEFLAHLCLFRYPKYGTIISGVYDLANPDGKDAILPQIVVDYLIVDSSAEMPAGTDIRIEARTGKTVRPDRTWSAWGPGLPAPAARYLQWRATLMTKRHDVTPRLGEVIITAGIRQLAAPSALTVIKDIKNQRIVRSSIDFLYQPPSERLSYLRKNWKLDDVVAPGKTEMEKFILLRNWSRKQWPNNEGKCDRPWDAINVLSAPEGDHGMCGHYAWVFAQCATSLGYNARVVMLAHHAVAEIWSDDLQKWVLMDVESVQPEGFARYGTAIYTRRGVPMSALELHKAYVANDTLNIVQRYCMAEKDTPFKEYPRVYGPDQYTNFEQFGYTPRFNYLDQREPWEEACGVDYVHSNYYFWWSDGPFRNPAEFSGSTYREGDIACTLDQAALSVTATADPAVLSVTVDTVTPNFKDFLVRVDGAAWQSYPGDAEDRNAAHGQFTWSIPVGTHTLEVRARNQLDHAGAISRVTLTRKAK